MSAAVNAQVPLGLVCNSYHRGGITSWMVDLAAEWAARGAECWFVAPRPRAPFVSSGDRPTVLDLLEKRYEGTTPAVVAPVVGREYEFGTEDYRATVYFDAVLGRVPAGVPLVVSDDPAAWQAAAWLTERNPLVGVLHADEDHYYRLVERYGSSSAALVCVSERIRRHASTLAESQGRRLVTIPCGTQIAANLQRSAELSGAPLRLIWIGRMDERQKRVSDLPKIASALRRLGLEFTLDLFGDGGDRGMLENAIRAEQVDGLVRLHGWRSSDELTRALSSADIMLMPSNFEGMSVAVMESLAQGCCVVASRVSGVEDYEQNPLAEGALWLHPVGDVAAVADCVAAAALVPREIREERSRSFAEAEFSISRNADRWAELLLALSPTHRPAHANLRRKLASVISYPVAAQRIARLWVRGRRQPGAALAPREVRGMPLDASR